MSENSELSSYEESIFDADGEYSDDEESSEEETLSAADYRLFNALDRNDADAAAEAVQQAIRDGANLNAVLINVALDSEATPLFEACRRGQDPIVHILLDAGADARWKSSHGSSAISIACYEGHLSTVQLLFNHDNGLLETSSHDGQTPLHYAIRGVQFDIVQFLLDSGANPHHVDRDGETALMHACRFDNLEVVRLLLAARADVEARDVNQRTALHHAAVEGRSPIMLELIIQHNANMFALDEFGQTPYDFACAWLLFSDAAVNPLLEMCGNRLTQDHGRLALHELLKVAKYSFVEDQRFHPPLNPLFRIFLTLGKLKLTHFRTLLHSLDPELIRTRDDTGKLPIHIACHTNAPVEVLAMILELDRNPTAALRIADSTGALPIHLLCNTTSATEYASVRYLVKQGGVGTLAVRNQQGSSPLHVFCGSTNPPLRIVQYLMQSFPGSVAMRTNAGKYPFMMAAAAESSSASLSVIYELVRANPGLVVPR